MKSSLLTLALAASFAAGGALAQTTATPPTGGDTGAQSGAYGSGWSTSLRSAIFSDGDTVRPESELSSQFATLSDEDKEMLRRDCEAHEQAGDMSGDDTTTTGAAMGAGAGMGATGTAGGATGAGGTTGTTETTAGAATGGSGTAGTAGGTAMGAGGGTGAATGGMTTVSAAQMEEICEAVGDEL